MFVETAGNHLLQVFSIFLKLNHVILFFSYEIVNVLVLRFLGEHDAITGGYFF